MTNVLEQNTEQAILDAATKLFVEKGFASTSTTEIAKEVGCNQAAVHYYYRTKEKLFESIFESKFRFFISKFLEANNDDIPFKEKLAKKIEVHFDLIKDNPKIPLFLINELGTNPKRLEKMKYTLGNVPKEAIGQFKEELDAEIKKGTVRKMDIFDLLLTIISLNIMLFLIGPIFKVVSNMTDESFEKMLVNRKKEHVRIILDSIKP